MVLMGELTGARYKDAIRSLGVTDELINLMQRLISCFFFTGFFGDLKINRKWQIECRRTGIMIDGVLFK